MSSVWFPGLCEAGVSTVGRGGGIGTSHFLFHVLTVYIPFLSGYHLLSLFLLQNIMQFCKLFPIKFLPFFSTLGIPLLILPSSTFHKILAPFTPNTHLYTWVEKSTVRVVSCLGTRHNNPGQDYKNLDYSIQESLTNRPPHCTPLTYHLWALNFLW